MHLKISDDKTLEWAAKEMLRCLVNLKYWDEKVQNEGGYRNRQNLRGWQGKRNDLLEKLEAYRSDTHNEQVIIQE